MISLTRENIQDVLIEESKHKTVFAYFYMPGKECENVTVALNTAISDDNPYISVVFCNVQDDICQAIAMQIGLQGVPSIVVFKDGRPQDAIAGNDIDKSIHDLVVKYQPSQAQLLLEKSKLAHDEGDLNNAIKYAKEAYELDSDLKYKFNLAKLYIKNKNTAMAHQLLDNPKREESSDQEYQDLLSALTLAEQAQNSPQIQELQQSYEQNQDDQTLVKLAIVLSQAGRNQEALEHLYKKLCEDVNNQEVKKTFLDILNTLSGDPLQAQYRRKLYTLMY